MGTYATTTSLQINMIGTTFDSLTTSLATRMITNAENEINKYLSRRYDITAFQTVTAVPPLVSSLCETLAEGYMHIRMSRGGKEALAHGKVLVDQVMGNLKEIADYKLDLLNTDGSVIAEVSGGGFTLLSNTDDYSTTFNEDDELSWSIDENKLSDIDSGRD